MSGRATEHKIDGIQEILVSDKEQPQLPHATDEDQRGASSAREKMKSSPSVAVSSTPLASSHDSRRCEISRVRRPYSRCYPLLPSSLRLGPRAGPYSVSKTHSASKDRARGREKRLAYCGKGERRLKSWRKGRLEGGQGGWRCGSTSRRGMSSSSRRRARTACSVKLAGRRFSDAACSSVSCGSHPLASTCPAGRGSASANPPRIAPCLQRLSSPTFSLTPSPISS